MYGFVYKEKNKTNDFKDEHVYSLHDLFLPKFKYSKRIWKLFFAGFRKVIIGVFRAPARVHFIAPTNMKISGESTVQYCRDNHWTCYTKITGKFNRQVPQLEQQSPIISIINIRPYVGNIFLYYWCIQSYYFMNRWRCITNITDFLL